MSFVCLHKFTHQGLFIVFKENFVRICNKRGVAPSAILSQCGLNTSTYSRWTDSTVPRRTTLIKLAECLEVSVDDLLADEPPATKMPPAEAGGLDLSAYPENIRKCVQAALQIPPEYREEFLRTVEELVRTSKQ